jgi:hypothetical protein
MLTAKNPKRFSFGSEPLEARIMGWNRLDVGGVFLLC